MEEYGRIHMIQFQKDWTDPEVACWMNPGSAGGRTTVRKVWMDLHDFRSRLLQETVYEAFDYDAALAWCAEHHYKVVRDSSTEVVVLHDACPDRIDFTAVGESVRVTHFDRRGMNDIPREHFTVEELGDTPKRWLQRICAWLEEHGYSTFWWGTGARAFRGKPWPIRTRREIFRKRQQIEEAALYLLRTDPGRWHDEETLMQLDLAYAG